MIVLICGGRDYPWGRQDEQLLEHLHHREPFLEGLTGGYACERNPAGWPRGVDGWAYAWARKAGIDRTPHNSTCLLQWGKHTITTLS